MAAKLGVLASVLVLGIGWSLVTAEATQDAPKQDAPKKVEPILAKFMREKLDASNQILEGLVVDDFGLIEKGAAKLEKMSNEEKWRVSNDAIYRQFSADFRRIAQQLQQDAKDKKTDAAALTWIKATMSCIECHKYTRGMILSGE